MRNNNVKYSKIDARAQTPKHTCIRDIGNTTEKNEKTRREVGVETQDRSMEG